MENVLVPILTAVAVDDEFRDAILLDCVTFTTAESNNVTKGPPCDDLVDVSKFKILLL